MSLEMELQKVTEDDKLSFRFMAANRDKLQGIGNCLLSFGEEENKPLPDGTQWPKAPLG
jgi:hypothetical protein